IEKIFLKASFLETGFSKIGQQEPLLKSYKRKYRYLVSGHYKIIYSVASEKVFIHTIFDTRQNPKKLKTRK
ncbi:MAG: type II toxin-antitoxin system RelE/ParE family toxin, partial [Bacteroidia bacterium]